jgi:aminopeptidase N
MTPVRVLRTLFTLAAVLAAIVVPSVVPAEEAERLPGDAVPTFQAITLNLDAAKNDYTGTTRVMVRVPKATKTIHFHAQEMKLTRVVLKGKGKSWPLTTKEGSWGFTTATAASEIPAGSYTLDIDFSNDFDRRATSLYRVESGGNAYTFTQFEAIDARGAFPCWDEPAYKIPYQVTIAVPAAHEAVSNTPVMSSTTSKGVKTVVFEKTEPLSSYLLCIATGPLEYVPMQGMSIPARIVVPKGSTALAQTAATMTPPLLKALEEYFGRPYPYKKLDLIAVPEFSPGAMENPGAITFGDRFILFDPKTMSTARKRLYAIFAAHEMAHQWFGDLVTMKWWDDLWLNESFADWMSYRIAGKVYPELGVDEYELQHLATVMAEDSRLSTHAIRQPVTNIDNLFEGIQVTYGKGNATIGMFERWMGPDVFRTAIRAYLKKYEWKNAVADDLWAELSAAAGKDVRTPMATFLDQPGIPLVHAELLDGGQVKLTQRRFLGYGVAAPEQRWGIPMTVRYPGGAGVQSHSFLFDQSAATIQLPGLATKAAWIDVNAGGGYYRTSVEPAVLATLSSRAQEILSTPERIRFIDNIGALVLAGEVKGDDFLRTLQGFANDPRPEVVNTLIGSLGQVKGAFVTTDLETPFSVYVRQVLGPAAQRFGWDRKNGEEDEVSILRPTLLDWMADEGRDDAALTRAEQLAQSFRADRGSIDPSLVNVALHLSAIRGHTDLFDEYQKRFEQATAPTDRDPLLEAMGSFRDPALRDRALAYSLGSTVRPHEVFTIPLAVLSRLENRDVVAAWAEKNHKAILDKIPPVYAPFVVYLGFACEQPALDRASSFYAAPEHSAPGMEVELKKMLEAGGDCVKLRAREGPAVARFLTQTAQGIGGNAPAAASGVPRAR